MYITIPFERFSRYSQSTRDEIMSDARVTASSAAIAIPAIDHGTLYDDVDMDDVADLTPKQMSKWMEGASDKTKSGLSLFADCPVVKAKELVAAGIDNLAHFQSRTTIRTRTITGDKGAFLLGWDDWEIVPKGEGRYAVTPTTHQSLRAYFKRD